MKTGRAAKAARPNPMSDKMLVVDDDPQVREALVLAFRTHYTVLEASSGADALRLLSESPRLMLLDMSMPGMTGLEVLAAARETVAGMTVIMLTGENDIDLAKRALALGAAEYITKPFEWDQLKERVGRCMGPAARKIK
jgi:DNA-binding response OmpR family regulator